MSPEQDQLSDNGNVTSGGGVGVGGAANNMDSLQPQQQEDLTNMESLQSGQQTHSDQLIEPMQFVQSTQPMQSTQQMQPIQSARPMQFIQPMASISSGTGDIVIDGVKEPKDRKKLLLIIGTVAVGVALLVLIIVGVSKLINGEVVASNAREAFNLYANYYLTGEVSTKDIVIEDSGEKIDERLESETNEEVLREYPVEVIDESDEFYDDTDYVDVDPSSESGDAVELVEREVLDSEVEDNDEPYFNMVYYGEVDDGNDYFDELKSFLVGFRDMYMQGVNDEDEIEDYSAFFDNCYSQLELAAINYGNGRLSEQEILDVFNKDGRDAAEDFISKKASSYLDYDEKYGTEMVGLITDYGGKALDLIERYANYGCVSNNGVDYGCVSGYSTEEDSAIAFETTKSAMNMQDVLDACVDNLFFYLNKMDSFVYEGEDVSTNEE